MSATKTVLALCFIFYFMNQASALKCYHCSSFPDGECWKNPAQEKNVEICSGSRSIVGTNSTSPNLEGSLPLSALANNISALIDSESSTMSSSTQDCLTLTGSLRVGRQLIRMCIPKAITNDLLEEMLNAHLMYRITISRCDTDLCNSSIPPITL